MTSATARQRTSLILVGSSPSTQVHCSKLPVPASAGEKKYKGETWQEGERLGIAGVLAAVTSSEGTAPGGYTSLLAGYTAILGPGLVLSGGLGVSYFAYGPVSQGGIHGFIPAAHSTIGWAF